MNETIGELAALLIGLGGLLLHAATYLRNERKREIKDRSVNSAEVMQKWFGRALDGQGK